MVVAFACAVECGVALVVGMFSDEEVVGLVKGEFVEWFGVASVFGIPVTAN